MELNRYWLLYSGILLVFLGSRTGQMICLCVFNALRSVFYLILALIAACGALFFYGLGLVFSWLSNCLRRHSENPSLAPSTRSKI